MPGVPLLRLQLANLGVTPSWYKKRGRGGVKAYLSASELRELVGRLKVAATARAECKWGDSPPERPSAYAAVFWTAPPTQSGFPNASTLPAYFQAGLWSALTKASLKVELFTFSQELHGVPEHESLTVVGAQQLLGKRTALSWLKCGATIQHIADVVRMLAVEARGGGWMLDGDVLWLRPPGALPSRSGHVFNSMHARWSVPYVAEPQRFWRMKHCRQPLDQLWFASPWHFPKGSHILGPVLREVQCFFEQRAKLPCTRGSGGRVAYNYVMQRVHARIVETGLVCDILEPTVMLPVPHWRHDWFVCPSALQAPRGEQGHSILSIAEIMESSTAVTPFLHSTKPKPEGEGTTATVVAKGSLLHEIYSALGLHLADGELPKTFWHSVVEPTPLLMEPVAGTPPRKRRRATSPYTRGCGGSAAAERSAHPLADGARCWDAPTKATQGDATLHPRLRGQRRGPAVSPPPC